jgi:hypothetical protein
MALKPVYGIGRKIPVIVTRSPAVHVRVISPYMCTVIIRGTCPTGTCSGSSWTFASWNRANFELHSAVCTQQRMRHARAMQRSAVQHGAER